MNKDEKQNSLSKRLPDKRNKFKCKEIQVTKGSYSLKVVKTKMKNDEKNKTRGVSFQPPIKRKENKTKLFIKFELFFLYSWQKFGKEFAFCVPHPHPIKKSV